MSDDTPLELTADERKALIALLHETLDFTRYPLAPRLDPLKAILAKLEPPKRKYEPPPPLTLGMGPSRGQADGEDRKTHDRI